MKTIKSLALLILSLSGASQAGELETQLRQAFGQDFAQSDAADVSRAEQLFRNSLAGQNSTAEWADLAMDSLDNEGLLLIREQPSSRRGRGLFVIRHPAGTQNWLLQAPHGDSDLYTGKIAARLFMQGPFRAGQWNTVPRNAGGEKREDTADMAHLDHSYWQAFTRAFAEPQADAKIIQLHGFDRSARNSKAASHTDMIVSAGHRQPPVWLQKTAQCLKNAWPGRVSLYPTDVAELGGTQNSQSRLLQNIGHQGFLHIEMSKALREQFLEQADARQQFIDCLSAAEQD